MNDQPYLPYGTGDDANSGWSGTDTSRERAERDDADGTTSRRQRLIIAALDAAGPYGATWKELAASKGWHHGQASGALSNLHKVGRIARLSNRRDRCAVYVTPENVEGRQTQPFGRTSPSQRRLATAERLLGHVRDSDLICPHHPRNPLPHCPNCVVLARVRRYFAGRPDAEPRGER